jgi:hypothetical protein
LLFFSAKFFFKSQLVDAVEPVILKDGKALEKLKLVLFFTSLSVCSLSTSVSCDEPLRVGGYV